MKNIIVLGVSCVILSMMIGLTLLLISYHTRHHECIFAGGFMINTDVGTQCSKLDIIRRVQ